MASFSPIDYVNSGVVRTAFSPAEATQLEWFGYTRVGQPQRPMALQERFVFGPVRPAANSVPPGTVYIKTSI